MAQCAAPKTSDTIRKSSRLRDRECPRPTGLSVDSLLHSNKGNGNGGNSVRKGEALLRRSAGYIFIPFQEIPRQARNDKQSARSLMGKTQAFCWFAPHPRKAELPPEGKPTAKRTFWEKSKLSGFFFQNGVFRLTRFGFYVIL